MEHAPLLSQEGESIARYTTEPHKPADAEANESAAAPLSIVEETKHIAKGALPLMLAFFLQYFLSIAPMFILGHIGSSELAAASLAIMTYNITGVGIIQGAVTVMDTFASQAYGAEQYMLVGDAWQKCTMIISIGLIPSYVIWFFAEPVLNALQPDTALSKLAQDYLRIVSLGTPGLVFFETGKRFLQAQKIFDAPTYVLMFVTPFSLFLTYLLVLPWGWGYEGAPVVVAITYWTMALLLLGYIFLVDGYQCWGGFSSKALFTEYGPMAKLAVPGVIMTEAEYMAFELMTLASSYFGTVALAAQSICTSVGSLVFQIPFALSCAITTHVAQLIGSGTKEGSIRFTKFALWGSLVVGALHCLILFAFEKPIIRIFTEDEDVISITAKVLPVLFINQVYDTVNITMAGILRAQGNQHIGSVLSIGSYYVIALPIAYVLAFKMSMGVFGLWLGLGLGVVIVTIAELVYIVRVDWDAVIEEAKNRTGTEDF